MSRLTINSNLPSLNAQRSLLNATKKLGDSFTRLSSGLRINKSSDDAAGLSISESLKADTRLFNQGIRNLNDGVSLLNIADGALNELSNITIRLRELATQSANGTFSNKQRLALDQEAQSLSKEYNRIARTTEFNGRKIFNGDFGDLSLAAGGGRESLVVDDLGGRIGDGSFAQAQSIGGTGFAFYDMDYADLNDDGFIDVVGSTIDFNVMMSNGDGTFKAMISYAGAGTPKDIKIADFNGDGIKDIAHQENSFFTIQISLGNGNGTFKRFSSYASSGQMSDLIIEDFNNDGILDMVSGNSLVNAFDVFLGNQDGSFKKAVSQVSNHSARGMISADIDGDGKMDMVASNYGMGTISLYKGNGDGSFELNSTIFVNSGPTQSILFDLDDDNKLDIVTLNVGGYLSVMRGLGDLKFSAEQNYTLGVDADDLDSGDLNGDGKLDLIISEFGTNTVSTLLGNGDSTFKARTSYAIGSNNRESLVFDVNEDGVIDILNMSQGTSLYMLIGNSNSGVSALQSFSLKTKQDSKDAMDYLSGALNRISKQRGEIGAFQSRLDVATSTLQTSALNYQEANSRITDIDVAEESSRLAATQILQQSASSILAQANLQPQLVLNLLRDL